MPIFHDEDDGPDEAMHGLPAALPVGESIRWQGRPNVMALSVDAFHLRSVALYFAVFTVGKTVFGIVREAPLDDIAAASLGTAVLGAMACAVLFVLAWAMARHAVFTVTNRRVVIRHGVAIRKYVNVPFEQIAGLSLRTGNDGTGNISIALESSTRIPVLHLWPFMRPLRIKNPVPLMRAVPHAADVADMVSQEIRSFAPDRFVHHGSVPSRSRDPHANTSAAMPQAVAGEMST